MKGPELLAPAGDLEKLKFAIEYGADAVYLGGKEWGLRAAAANFTLDELRKATAYVHKKHKKIYVTINIFAHNKHLKGLPQYLFDLNEIGVDGIIVSDPGIIMMAKEVIPHMPIHLSTQANTTNWKAVQFWASMGIKRIVLARELSLNEILEIKSKVKIEIEAFVHGAMCMSYSGRCLLSNFLVGRGANQGECAHPCRYKYYLLEEKRPNQKMSIEEDEKGSYILNSKDLCMIEYVPDLMKAGIDCFKIEGRMKSLYYVAMVVKAYREAIDACLKKPANDNLGRQCCALVNSVSHREYTTGFYFSKVNAYDHNYDTSAYKHTYDFIGIVKGYDYKTKRLIVEQRNSFKVGEKVEFVLPKGSEQEEIVLKMYDEGGQEIERAPHPQQIVQLAGFNPMPDFAILRRKKGC